MINHIQTDCSAPLISSALIVTSATKRTVEKALIASERVGGVASATDAAYHAHTAAGSQVIDARNCGEAGKGLARQTREGRFANCACVKESDHLIYFDVRVL